MKFYKNLSKVKAISFDLDDTLYSNRPVMLAIEKKMIAYFACLSVLKNSISDQNKILDQYFWQRFRRLAIQGQPELQHDVVRIRLVTYRLGFKSLGLSDKNAEHQAQAALDYFIQLRSDFNVPEQSKKLLAELGKKYPLIAISNGNVDTATLGIAHYFQHIYHAGWQADGALLKQKPANDMFNMACQQLNISLSELLHVGDCGRADIQGALLAGCQAAWFSCYGVGKPVSMLPHVKITSIDQLTQLV